jgi:arabinosaccharide transport system substrate-binding protein
MQLSPGSWIICVLALVSSVVIAIWPVNHPPGHGFWTFNLRRTENYGEKFKQWNDAHAPEKRFYPVIISIPALERRLLSGFLSDTPVPDLVEIEANMAPKFFSGPLDAVGLVDLTEPLKREGLLEKINGPSFSPWTSRGHIFGLPNDVHPVMLGYRADIVEAAGIDVSKIETWDDFIRVMKPLMADRNKDGRPDRYLLNIWETNQQALEILMLQAGGGFFDDQLRPVINSDINADVLSRIVQWTGGPERIGINAPNQNAEGNFMFLDGQVLCNMMPDWLAGVWTNDMPGMKGKMKFMPLPAWSKGGRRTSVLGGTMLGIPKRSSSVENSWALARDLYFDPALADTVYRQSLIITPVKTFWSSKVYDEPVPYYSNQPVGRLFISVADQVPARTSSPFKTMALYLVTDALVRLKAKAESTQTYDKESLVRMAHEELASAQHEVEKKMAINIFLDPNKIENKQ